MYVLLKSQRNVIKLLNGKLSKVLIRSLGFVCQTFWALCNSKLIINRQQFYTFCFSYNPGKDIWLKNKIKQNCIRAGNFDACFFVFFNRFYQEFISGRKTGRLGCVPTQFWDFLNIFYFSKSPVVWQLVTQFVHKDC